MHTISNNHQFQNVAMPQQANWVIRQILSVRAIMNHVHYNDHPSKIMVRMLYLHPLGDRPQVSWKCLVFQNNARLKSIFTMWLQLHERLLTTNRLLQ